MPTTITVADFAAFLAKAKGASSDEFVSLLAGATTFNDNEANVNALIRTIESNRQMLKTVRKQLKEYKRNAK